MASLIRYARGLLVARRARTQVGKRYATGGNGPNAFDCSGSVEDAWRPYRPHWSDPRLTSSGLTRAPGVRLMRADVPANRAGGTKTGPLLDPARYLLKGDLVFYYADPISDPAGVSHVALYVGNGLIVNATGDRNEDGSPRPLDRQIELIGIDQYADPTGYGLVGH